MKVHLANLRDGVDGAVTDEQRRSLSRVEANLSRLQILIDELLDLSQIEMGQASLQVEPVPLGNVIAKAVEDLSPLAQERKVRIVLSLSTNLPDLCADPDKLHQIILNLLHNAVKFSPSETTVEISAARSSNDTVCTSVSDVGPGIALEDVDKVFQPFYRASTMHKKAKGAGLGLAIAKLLVELHHGRLWVETAPGKGSCFSFTLPCAGSITPSFTDATIPGHPDHHIAHR